MKFSKKDLESATQRMGLLKYWVREPGFNAEVQAYLALICPHKEALEWLVSALVNHIGEWPGPHELRGLLCTKYNAADGIDAYCSLPGFSPTDFERKHLQQHESLIGSDEKFISRIGARSMPAIKLLQPAQDGLDLNYETGCATCGRYPTIGMSEQCAGCRGEG